VEILERLVRLGDQVTQLLDLAFVFGHRVPQFRTTNERVAQGSRGGRHGLG